MGKFELDGREPVGVPLVWSCYNYAWSRYVKRVMIAVRFGEAIKTIIHQHQYHISNQHHHKICSMIIQQKELKQS